MKKVPAIILLLSSIYSFSQTKSDSASINDLVKKIDSMGKTNSRPSVRYQTVEQKRIKEYWTQFDNSNLSRITIDYTIDSTQYTEKFYFQHKSLVYVYEKEIFFSPALGVEQNTTWSGNFYFLNEKLIDYITQGHGHSELDDWNPEKELLVNSKRRTAELRLLK